MILTFNTFCSLSIEMRNIICHPYLYMPLHRESSLQHLFFIKPITMKKNNESTIFVVGIAQVAFFLFIMLLIGAIAG